MAQNPSILGLLIGMVLIGLFAGIIGLSLGQFETNYDVDQTGAINLSKYNKLDDLQQQAVEIEGNTKEIEQPSGILDVLGGFFYNAYKVLTAIPDSLILLYDMIEAGTTDMKLGAGGVLLKNAITTIIIFIIFIGIILSILLKRDGL